MTTDLRVGSRAKIEDTLVEKLQRHPNWKLDAIQDIAGVRVDADLHLGEQTTLAREIASHFGADESAIYDLRDGSHAGYRAVHVRLRRPAGRVEIQVRTILQSLWANLYEKLADDVGRGIRYGEPVELRPDLDPDQVQRVVQGMQDLSAMLAEREAEWQQNVDEQNGVAIGADAMQKLMIVGSVMVSVGKFNTEAGIEGEGG